MLVRTSPLASDGPAFVPDQHHVVLADAGADYRVTISLSKEHTAIQGPSAGRCGAPTEIGLSHVLIVYQLRAWPGQHDAAALDEIRVIAHLKCRKGVLLHQ